MDAMPFLQHHNTMIAQAALAQFLSLGQSNVGTQSLAKEHTEIFQLAEEAHAGWIEETLNRQLIRRWCRLNYGQKLKPPLLRHRKIAARDLGAWTAALNSWCRESSCIPGRMTRTTSGMRWSCRLLREDRRLLLTIDRCRNEC